MKVDERMIIHISICEHVQTSTHIIGKGLELLNTAKTQTIVFFYLYYDKGEARAHTRYNFNRAIFMDNADAGEISTQENRKCINYFTSCLLDKKIPPEFLKSILKRKF